MIYIKISKKSKIKKKVSNMIKIKIRINFNMMNNNLQQIRIKKITNNIKTVHNNNNNNNKMRIGLTKETIKTGKINKEKFLKLMKKKIKTLNKLTKNKLRRNNEFSFIYLFYLNIIKFILYEF